MSKYLVIGGNGIIGHFVTRRLVAQGHRPVVMSRAADPALIRDILDRCDLVAGDVTDPAMTDHVVRMYGITHVAHLGAVLPSAAEDDPALGIRINVEGVANILSASVKSKVSRVILASSKGAYGRPPGRHAGPEYLPMPEAIRPYPFTVYGIAKVAAEQLGTWYMKKHGIEVASLRFATTVGPGKISRHGGHFSRSSLIVESAMAGKLLTVDEGGDSRSDTIYNDDAARGIVSALQATSLKYDLYNIGTGSGITLKEYAAAAMRAFPGSKIVIGDGEDRSGAQNFVMDVSRAKENFGFTADPSPDHIVKSYVDTMKLLGLMPEV